MSFLGILIVTGVVFLGAEIIAEVLRVFNSKIMKEIDEAIARYDRERKKEELKTEVNKFLGK